MNKRLAWLALLAALFASPAHADEEPDLMLNPSTQAAIEEIKRKIQQLSEQGRADRWQFYAEISQGAGYETNPGNTPERHSSFFTQSDLYVAASKQLAPELFFQSYFLGSYLVYPKYSDGDYALQTLTPIKLLWRPGPVWRIDAGVDLEWLDYFNSKIVDYVEIKPWGGVRQNLGRNWYHAVRYEWFLRDYLSTRARSGTGQATFSSRQDERHLLRYELGTAWKQLLLRARYEWYINDSNDARRDFYDTQDHRLVASASYPLLRKLMLNASYAFERRDYNSRRIGRAEPEFRYDDLQSWTLSATYTVNETWSITPFFSYRENNSNEPLGEYTNNVSSVSATARF
jgi:hypothetical protein